MSGNVAFVGGIVVAAAAVSPPVHSVAHDSFGAHMTQHLLLMIVAAPLVAYGRLPKLRLVPLVVVLVNAVVVWAWHAPAIYTAALESNFLHVVEHAMFFVVSWLLWAVVLSPSAGYLQRVMAVFVTGLQSSALGAILAFASVVLYPVHDPARFGLTPLEDQQLAGSIMWVPPGFVYLVTIIALLFSWFSHLDDAVAGAGDR